MPATLALIALIIAAWFLTGTIVGVFIGRAAR